MTKIILIGAGFVFLASTPLAQAKKVQTFKTFEECVQKRAALGPQSGMPMSKASMGNKYCRTKMNRQAAAQQKR
jgi:hypothetical protein